MFQLFALNAEGGKIFLRNFNFQDILSYLQKTVTGKVFQIFCAILSALLEVPGTETDKDFVSELQKECTAVIRPDRRRKKISCIENNGNWRAFCLRAGVEDKAINNYRRRCKAFFSTVKFARIFLAFKERGLNPGLQLILASLQRYRDFCETVESCFYFRAEKSLNQLEEALLLKRRTYVRLLLSCTISELTILYSLRILYSAFQDFKKQSFNESVSLSMIQAYLKRVGVFVSQNEIERTVARSLFLKFSTVTNFKGETVLAARVEEHLFRVVNDIFKNTFNIFPAVILRRYDMNIWHDTYSTLIGGAFAHGGVNSHRNYHLNIVRDIQSGYFEKPFVAPLAPKNEVETLTSWWWSDAKIRVENEIWRWWTE